MTTTRPPFKTLLPMRLHTPMHTPMRAAWLAVALLTLAACGSKEAKAPTATQVAAKVGSEEISVHQINQVLARTNTNGASPEQIKALSREVLEKLIDQQIAIDQATEKKLHRSPDVVAEIEAARRDILARAYVQSVTGEVAKPTREDVRAYFAANPALFAERRIFNLQEIVVANEAATADGLRDMVAAGKTLEEMAAWLKGKNIRFNGGAVSRAAEQIPLEALPKVQALKDGQTTVLQQGASVTVLRMVSSQLAPVTEEEAAPRIQQFLANQRGLEAIGSTMKQLRAATQVTYMGEFDTTKPAPDAGAALIK